mgnify:CR=1 FL=1
MARLSSVRWFSIDSPDRVYIVRLSIEVTYVASRPRSAPLPAPAGTRGPGAAREYHVSAHNTYITLGYDYGILGIIGYIILIGWGAFKVLRYGWHRTTTYFFLSFQVAYYSLFAHDVHANAVFAVMFASFLTNASLDEPAGKSTQASPSAPRLNPGPGDPTQPQVHA